MGLLREMHLQGQGRRLDTNQMMTTATLDQRVAALEKEMDEMNKLLETIITKLESMLGIDLDGMEKFP